MKLTKTVTSRRGNVYIVDLTLVGNDINFVTVKDENGKEVFVGSGGLNRKYNKNNYLVESVHDIILHVEEKYSNYESLKAFEIWNGKIN
ncbi:hypothetical protein [Bacillus xiapuensis]|uniref:Uncharacterized protein n=1 Tax=Bacillus xiapuensis TaxID=2014075 RepID=A0ABU6N8B6_9BACI|nr:hypothetical protein [Bacillus xiapuensis]